jgi:16S rRNA processing protein RimM
MADDLVLVGAALGAFGVRGEVRVRSFTADPDAVCRYGPLRDEAGRVALTPKRWRPIKDGLAVTAPEVSSREAAEALRGTGLYVPRAALPAPDEDEFYHVDLIGCAVETLEGAPLGVVRAVQDFGAGDLLLIAPADGAATWFLPFTKAAVPRVDLAARRLVAVPPVADEDAAP